MNEPRRPTGEPDPSLTHPLAKDLASTDVEPVVSPPMLGPTLAADGGEELTAEDLAARATVGFALDLEPLLPGPPVGSERILLEEDPEAARRLGVDPHGFAASPWAGPPAHVVPLVEPPPPPAGVPGMAAVDVEPVLHAALPPEPPGPSAALPPAPAPAPAPASEVAPAPASAVAPAPLATEPVVPVVPLPPPPPPPTPLPVVAPPSLVSFSASPSWGSVASSPPPVMTPRPLRVDPRPTVRVGHQRSYPKAWAWAGLGECPVLGPAPERRVAAAAAPVPQRAAMALAEDLLEIAAVGKDPNGLTEMHLVFKEDVLRGLVCKLRFQPEGLHATFVAPDDSVRRYLESTAPDLVERMRRRGMRVAGWEVEVSR